MTIEVLFGWIASLLCTLILVPQILKAYTTRHTDDISMFMLLLSVAGNSFWVAHAVMTVNVPLIVGAGPLVAGYAQRPPDRESISVDEWSGRRRPGTDHPRAPRERGVGDGVAH